MSVKLSFILLVARMNSYSNYYTNIKLDADVSCNNDEKIFKNDGVLIGERRYSLNKSKCKFISVGLSHEFGYQPFIKLSGLKNDEVIFDENEWNQLLSYQGIITNYLYSYDKTEDVNAGKFFIQFEQFSNIRVIKIVKNTSQVYLGYETVCKLWELLSLINYRINILKKHQFVSYFNVLRRGLQNQTGNIFVNALDILRPQEIPNSENVSLVMELIHMYPDIFEKECSVTV